MINTDTGLAGLPPQTPQATEGHTARSTATGPADLSERPDRLLSAPKQPQTSPKRSKSVAKGRKTNGKGTRPRKITALEQRFVDAYTNPKSPGFNNPPEAAKIAGYSPKHAAAQASKVLKRDRVVVAIGLRTLGVENVRALDREGFIARALEQADAWLDVDDSGARAPRVETYSTRSGALYDRISRPSTAEVRALELAGRASGHISEGEAGAGLQVNFVVALPEKATDPRQWLDSFRSGDYGRSITDGVATTYEDDPEGS